MSEHKDKPTDDDDTFLQLGIVIALVATEGLDLEFESSDEQQQSSSSTKTSVKHQNTLGVKTFVKDKAIEMYAKKAMEDMKKNLKKSEPMVLGTVNKETIKDSDYNLTFQLSNVKIFNLGALQVKKFKSTSEKNMVEFSLAIPFIKLKSNYDVNGTFQNKKIQGKGDAEIQVTNVSVDNGRVVIKETPQEIQIQEVSVCYDFKDMTIKQTGLSIEGVEPNKVTDMLRSVATKYLKEQKKKICDRLAAELKSRANAKLKGKTKDQLGDLMK